MKTVLLIDSIFIKINKFSYSIGNFHLLYEACCPYFSIGSTRNSAAMSDDVGCSIASYF